MPADTDEATQPPSSPLLDLPPALRIITLNCWGLKYISQHRHARLTQIGRELAATSPSPEIVGLQECWTQEDFLAIRDLTKHILPHAKFYWSGIFGGGLAILSKWPIEETSMYRYPLNGRPSAFWRGDWYVGKGVACARIRIGGGERDVVEVFNTHTHAPYERKDDSYLCHRTAQAWEIAKLMRHAAERGHMVVGLGDFNMVPLSLAHRIIEAHAPVRDIWRVVKPDSALGGAWQDEEKERLAAKGLQVPTARQCLMEHGATCDSTFNTWRWSKQMRKGLEKGRDHDPDPKAQDPRARRLDYVFFADNGAYTGESWEIDRVEVGMTQRHPELRCSLSDHFSVEATFKRGTAKADERKLSEKKMVNLLPTETYNTILAMIDNYTARQRRFRRTKLTEFGLSILVSIGCFVAIWWSPRNYVSFILLVLSTLGFGGGILEGLMGGLFVGSELRALREFEYEVKGARGRAEEAEKMGTKT